jgi:nucleoside-diphosphate-sugar epimerase
MKILILGDGLLGSEIQKQTGWNLISRKKDGFDITHPDTLEKFTLEWIEDLPICKIGRIVKYDIVVNCIANTDSYSKDKTQHWDVNYKGVSYLVDFCNKHNIKLVHISTEFVYANNKEIPTEEDIPQPDNTWYAYTKLLADEYIKLKSNNYLICRELHKPYPFPYPEVWDVKTSGDTVDKIAELIIKLINKGASGVFNVGTGSKYLYNLAPNSIVAPTPNHVPKDTRMNLDKLNKWLSEN